jgi:hypothetical protein
MKYHELCSWVSTFEGEAADNGQANKTDKIDSATLAYLLYLRDLYKINLNITAGPFGTVPELLFEKKGLIPALQQLFIPSEQT